MLGMGGKEKGSQVPGVHGKTMSEEKRGVGMKKDERRKVPRERLKVLIREMT